MHTRFSLQRLFVSTALIAVGLAILVRVIAIKGLYHWIVDFPLCFIGGMILGAGLLVPIGRGFLGAAIGLLSSAIYLAAVLLRK